MLNTESIASELKEYMAFRDSNPGFTLSAYAWLKLTPDLLIATMSLLGPKFIIHNGGLFFEEGFSPEVFDQWMDRLSGNLHDTERIMNHRHVRDLMQDQREWSESLARFLEEAIIGFWRSALTSQFPNLSVVVASEWDAENSDVVVSVYQEKKEGTG